MASWGDRKHWDQLVSGEACPICLQGRPHGVVIELEGCYLTVDRQARVKGYCCLVSKRHAAEVHELSEDEAGALMRDLRRVSAAVKQITGAVKMNQEIHGNTIPHLHVHVIPRYRGDELEEKGKTLGTLEGVPWSTSDSERFVAELRDALLR